MFDQTFDEISSNHQSIFFVLNINFFIEWNMTIERYNAIFDHRFQLIDCIDDISIKIKLIKMIDIVQINNNLRYFLLSVNENVLHFLEKCFDFFNVVLRSKKITRIFLFKRHFWTQSSIFWIMIYKERWKTIEKLDDNNNFLNQNHLCKWKIHTEIQE